MKDKKLKQLKDEYMNTNIPDDLSSVVKNTIKKNKIQKYKLKRTLISTIVPALSIVLLINISPTFANTLSEVTVLAPLVKLVTLKEYIIDKNNYEVNIKIPKIEGLEDINLEKRLNEEFLSEGENLYNELTKEVNLKDKYNKYVSTDYTIKSQTEDILSIEISKLEIQASSYNTKKHYTIDKKRNIVLTLPMLFTDERYIDIISENIKEQMRDQMKNSDNAYFIDSKEYPENNFEKINKNQDFYINEEGKLVISFNQYDVAPGYMGAVEFVIPSEVLKGL